MAVASEGDRVRIRYSCSVDGAILDFEESRDPLEFVIGEGETIPALERVVVGMAPGERRRVVVPASQITGVDRAVLEKELGVCDVPGEVTHVPSGIDIGPGDDGDVAQVLVPAISASRYSLAGKDVVFDIHLLQIVSSGDEA